MPRVEFFGAMEYLLGTRGIPEIPGSTLKEVLRTLEGEYPVLRGTLMKGGKVSSLFLIYVDGKDSRLLQGLDTVLSSTSCVKIMKALAGG